MNNYTFHSIGIIGAGQMGSGIAQVCASAGSEVYLYDMVSGSAEKAKAKIQELLSKKVAKGEMSQVELEQTLTKIHPVVALNELSSSDLIIEAIIENVAIKVDLFSKLSLLVKPECILASNTSSISITRMAAAVSKPERFIGIHFMNPVPVMKLVELIRGLQTNDETYQRAVEFCSLIKKTPVLALDQPGFIVNRVLVPMINEAIFLLQEGVKAADIDTAMKLGTNQPMGPLTLADFVGLDTLLYILQILHRELGEDKYRPCPLLVKYVEAGWLGKKVGRGFYTYP